MLYIYLTENLINGRVYVGKHTGDLDDNYLGSGVILKRAIEKYGVENFKKTILATAATEEVLNDLEIYWVKHYRNLYGKKLYNLTDGGTGGNTCIYLPKEVVSKTRSGWFQKMTPEEQERLKQLKSETMKANRQDTEREKKRIAKLKNTIAQKSPEEKVRLYDNRRGERAPNRKSVKTPLGIFPTLTAAAQEHGITVTTVTNRCNHVGFREWEWL